jgi:large subunit ribosomal protein L21
MSSAIIKTGGKQYRVTAGDVIRVATLTGEAGASVVFDQVLAVTGETAKIGLPLVAGAKVEAQIVRHGRGPKIVVFKLKRRKRFKVKKGHRQDFTEVRVTSISS